jgi:hypothetical protein
MARYECSWLRTCYYAKNCLWLLIITRTLGSFGGSRSGPGHQNTKWTFCGRFLASVLHLIVHWLGISISLLSRITPCNVGRTLHTISQERVIGFMFSLFRNKFETEMGYFSKGETQSLSSA